MYSSTKDSALGDLSDTGILTFERAQNLKPDN
jgi:hypothetical protein